MTVPECATCHHNGRRGYCAPGRCYCGHNDCHAFASWQPLPPIPDTTPTTTRTPRASSWDTREEPTWIDQL